MHHQHASIVSFIDNIIWYYESALCRKCNLASTSELILDSEILTIKQSAQGYLYGLGHYGCYRRHFLYGFIRLNPSKITFLLNTSRTETCWSNLELGMEDMAWTPALEVSKKRPWTESYRVQSIFAAERFFFSLLSCQCPSGLICPSLFFLVPLLPSQLHTYL